MSMGSFYSWSSIRDVSKKAKKIREVQFSLFYFFFHQRYSQVKKGSEDNKLNLVETQANTSVMDSFHARVIEQQLISMAARTFPNIDLSLHPKHRLSAYSVYHIANSAHGFDFPFRCFLRYFTIWVLITLIERSSELSPQ